MKKTTTLILFLIIGAFVYAQTPIANASSDTLICGHIGTLNAIPSSGTGVWFCDDEQISITEPNNPQSEIISEIINTGNPGNPNFELVWTETNIEGTDSDTIQIIFARIPISDMYIIPPKCFGEPATIAAVEDSLHQYVWNFYGGICDDTVPPNNVGGYDRHYPYWENEDTSHIVGLIATNSYGCQSIFNIDTVYEPPIPQFDHFTISDTCNLGVGGIVFEDTLSNNTFYWINENIGPETNTPFTTVYNLPANTYNVRTVHLTSNPYYDYYFSIFGSSTCIDTIPIIVREFGSVLADISISADIYLPNLAVGNANVVFVNNTTSDFENTISILDFGDGSTYQTNYTLVEHIYTEAGCFTPNIISFVLNMPQCRDTAFIEPCLFIDGEESEEKINHAYPNPSSNSFSIQLINDATVDLYLYNSNGNIILQIEDYYGQAISAVNLDAGVYIAKYFNGAETICVSVVIG